jgi:hypothetical protein
MLRHGSTIGAPVASPVGLNSAYGAQADKVFIEKRSGCSRQAYPVFLIGSNVSTRSSGGDDSCPLSQVSVRQLQGLSSEQKSMGGGGRSS